jgi:hypothetical protein
MSTNPFDDDAATPSSWSTTSTSTPCGRRSSTFPPAGASYSGRTPRADCLAYVERHWTDMRPRSLRESMAAD